MVLEIWQAWRGGGGYRDAEESEDGAEIDRYQDDGTETGGAQVGKLLYVAAQQE